MELLSREVRDLYFRYYREVAEYEIWAPGRVNLIGDHTDYVGGKAIPSAIDRYHVCAFGKTRLNMSLQVFSENYPQEILELQLGETPCFDQVPRWQKFVYGMYFEFSNLLKRSQRSWRYGGKAVIISNLPDGKGLSSSAAFASLLLNLFSELSEVTLNKVEQARLCQVVENKYLKTPCGLLDQVACICSEKNTLQLVNFEPFRLKNIPVSSVFATWVWVCVDLNIRRELGESGYKDRVGESQLALNRLMERVPGSKILDDLSLADLDLDRCDVDNLRLRHILSENQRVESVGEALIKGDVVRVGELLNRSHLSLKENHQVSLPPLDLLQQQMTKHPSVAGARLMGGGFGGCILALVQKNTLSSLKDYLETLYDQSDRSIDILALELTSGVWCKKVSTLDAEKQLFL